MIMDEIIKHDEGLVPVKVKLASLPSVAQANVNFLTLKISALRSGYCKYLK